MGHLGGLGPPPGLRFCHFGKQDNHFQAHEQQRAVWGLINDNSGRNLGPPATRASLIVDFRRALSLMGIFR